MSPSRALLLSTIFLCFLEATVRCTAEGAAPSEPQIKPGEKSLPAGAIARAGSLRLRHKQEVRAIAFSPDGKKIASVPQDDTTIRVWDVPTGKLLHEFDAPRLFSREFFAPKDYTLAFTPDGKSIAAGVGAEVCFWDFQSGREVRRFRGKGKGILALTFSPDARSFYCGGSDNKLYQWDIATGTQVRSWDYFEVNQPRVYDSGFAEKKADLKAISGDGKTAVWLVEHWADNGNSASRDDAKLMIWDTATGKDRCPLTDKNDKELSDADVVLSPNGKYLTAFTRNSEMIVWDTTTGKKLKTLGDGGSVEAVAYSADSRRVAVLDRWIGHKLSVWDLTTAKKLWHHDMSPWYLPGWDKSLAFSPDGKSLALAQWKNVLIWDVESGRETPLLEGHRWPIRTLEFLENHGALLSADLTCVCEWDSAFRQTRRHPLIAYHGATLSVAESHEAKLRIFQPEGKPPQLRELFSDKLLCEFDQLKGSRVHGCFSADGRTVALLQGDKKTEVTFLDVPSRKVRSSLAFNELIDDNVILSRDGKMLAVSSSDQTVVLIDSFSGKIVRWLGTPRPALKDDVRRTDLTKGAFSPDGQLLAFGTRMHRPDESWKWKFGGRDAIPPDPPGIRVWQVATGRELRQFEKCLEKAAHGWIASLRFSPDNKSLAVGLTFNPSRPGDPEEAVVPVLEVASGKFRRRFKGHTAQVASVAFSPDGKILASGGEDSSILLWDMQRPLAAEPAAGKPAAERLTLHWRNLGEEDAASAYDAVLALAQMQDQCVAFLTERLKPVELPAAEQLAKWIADLDSHSFKVRAEASAKLVALHDLAGPALRKALEDKLSLEVRRRIEEIVTPLDTMKYSTALMRELRSVEVLERIGTKKARQLLELLAGGAAEAILTVEAKASLARLSSTR